MSEHDLTPQTGLAHVAVPGRYGAPTQAPGVVIAVIDNLSMVSVMVRAGKLAALSAAAVTAFGVALPMTPRRVDGGGVAFAWAGPGQWLALAENTSGHVFTDALRREFAGLASVVDQSDGRVIVRVSGPQARQALAKGIPIDLDPVSFHPGDTALTVVGHINVQFWQRDETPVYEFAVFRSFAASFFEWLKEAGAEFGVAVAADL